MGKDEHSKSEKWGELESDNVCRKRMLRFATLKRSQGQQHAPKQALPTNPFAWAHKQ